MVADSGKWRCVLALDRQRRPVEGSPEALSEAIRRGADLRIATSFRHNEHIDPASSCPEPVLETAEFRATYLVDDRWAAGVMTLRQPVSLPDGFGPRPSMSFFLYNQDGSQAIARPYLDGAAANGAPGPSPLDDHSAMPKYHQYDNWDAATNAPSSNFVYEFDEYRFFVRDGWTQVLSHTETGDAREGSVDELARAFNEGCDIKVALRGLCADLGDGPPHEVMIQTGSNYFYTDRKLFVAGTHPLVRIRAAVPMRYASVNWDFGWLVARSDGHVARRLVDPRTLAFHDSETRCAMRWFAR